MFLSQEIDIKLCQIDTKIYIYKTDHTQQIHNQTENKDISEKPKKLKFTPIIIRI